MKSSKQSKCDSGVVYVGIDVSKDTLSVFAGGLFEGDVPNTRKGIAGLVRRQTGKARDVRFAFEETGACECGCGPTPVPTAVRLELRDLIRTRGLLSKARSMFATLRLMTRSATCRTVLGEAVRFLDARIARMEREMVATARQDDQIRRVAEELDKLPGVAPLTATTVATLAPELGSLGRRRAASLCGLTPVPRESGHFKGQRRIGGGRAELRRALYMPVLTAVRSDPVLKTFYERLVKVGKKPKKLALAACMRKMIIHMDRVVARLDKTTETPAS